LVSLASVKFSSCKELNSVSFDVVSTVDIVESKSFDEIFSSKFSNSTSFGCLVSMISLCLE